jgi:hypothetical protein
MTRWVLLMVCTPSVFFLALASAAPPAPEEPSPLVVEVLVNRYVDKDFIHEQLPPPDQCGRYTEKLMFAYDWQVVIHHIGPYDPARKLVPVTATVVVRCGPFRPQPPAAGEAPAAAFPLRSETPIDFQLSGDPELAQPWAVQEVTLWKSKQRVIEP